MTATFAGFKPHVGAINERTSGNLLSSDTGTVTAYALEKLKSNGTFFVKPGDEVYPDQIVGINGKGPMDLKVNVSKTKHLSNVRAAGKEDHVSLTPAKEMSLEDAVEYIS